MDDLTVHVQIVVEAVVCVVVDACYPEVPARRHIAALLAWRSVPIEILADERDLISGRVQFRRDRLEFVPGILKCGEPRVLPGVAQDAVVMCVLPTQY